MASIGSLTADLKLESAAFIRDLNKAAQATARNTSAMQRSVAKLQSSFARVGSVVKGAIAGFVSVQSVRSLASLTRTAVDAGDEIATAATKIGISGEELQRFRFAAEQADVEISQLDIALRKFQQNLASGKIKSQSFDAFIQSIREAPTQIEKMRIATEALGERAAQTGILLAASGDDFAKNYRQAFVVSEDALKIASALDNQWRELQNAVATGFETGFLEAFADEAGRGQEQLKQFNEAARTFGSLVGGMVSGAGQIATAFVGIRDAVFQAREEIRKQQAERAGLQFVPTLEFGDLPKLKEAAEATKPALDGINQSLASNADIAKAASEANRQWLQNLQEGTSIFDATRGPLEAYRIEVEKLSEALKNGSIDSDTFSRAQTQAAAGAIQPWLGVADTVAGALGTLFKDNKAVAIAQAVINTAQGITAALAQYPPPLSFAMAAAQAAAGAAQIAAIKSTNVGTSKTPKASGGGGGGGSGGRSRSPAPAQPTGQAINITLLGHSYGEAEIRQIIDGINKAGSNGARISNISVAAG